MVSTGVAVDVQQGARHGAGRRGQLQCPLLALTCTPGVPERREAWLRWARQALAAADALMDRLPEGERSDTWLTYGEQRHHVPLGLAVEGVGAGGDGGRQYRGGGRPVRAM